jgi:cytochrome c oxidase assembly factor CtaG
VAPEATSWHAAWAEVALVLVLAVAYAAAARRHRPSRARIAAFAASVSLLLLVSVTPLATMALHYLLAAHLVQNVVMAEWAPALAVAGVSAGMATALARHRLVRAATHPFVALFTWLGAYGFWHVPAVYDYALRHGFALHLEHVTYFLAGTLLWWPVLQDAPRRLSSGAKAVYLFAAFVLASPIGLLLALLPEPVYDYYEEAPRLWGLTPLEDQQIAGVLMTVSEAIVFFGVFAFFFVRFMAEEEAGYSQPRA